MFSYAIAAASTRSIGKSLSSNSAEHRCTTNLVGIERRFGDYFATTASCFVHFCACTLANITSLNAVRLYWTQPQSILQLIFPEPGLMLYILDFTSPFTSPFSSSALPLASPLSSAALPLASSACIPAADAALFFASTVGDVVSSCIYIPKTSTEPYH